MIYLDHHAATPMTQRVRDRMAATREVAWANPSSAHAAGRAARAVVQRAREALALALGAKGSEIIFTAGGTEACNLGVFGVGHGCKTIVTTDIEHPAVLMAVQACERAGAQVIRVPTHGGHAVDLDRVAAALGPGDLCCVQWVNHETGGVQPIAALGERCEAVGAHLFVDATQALGKLPVEMTAAGASAMAFASSKIGGPPAVGALWLKRGVNLAPRQVGGSQERGLRAGSPDPVAIAGFGEAALELPERLDRMEYVGELRDRVERALIELGGLLNGSRAPRVSTVTNLSFLPWRGSHLVAALDLMGVCCSSGAACSSGVDEGSAVIAAMYPKSPERAGSALRLSFSPSTREDEVDRALGIIAEVVRRKPMSRLRD